MRRSIVWLLMLLNALTLAGAATASGAPAPRREEHIYNGSRGGGGQDETNLQDLVFTSREHERFVRVVVTDTTERPVGVIVSEDTDEDGTADITYEVCGTTESPLRITGGPDLNVHVETAPCDGVTGATTGVVEMFFFTSKKQAQRWDMTPEPPAPPADGDRRTVEGSYYGTAAVGVGDTDLHISMVEASGVSVGGAIFTAASTETHVEAVVTDASGLPTRATIQQHVRGAPPEPLATICGKTDEPVAIQPGVDISVAVMNGPCPDGSPAAATQGTVTVTFLSP